MTTIAAVPLVFIAILGAVRPVPDRRDVWLIGRRARRLDGQAGLGQALFGVPIGTDPLIKSDMWGMTNSDQL